MQEKLKPLRMMKPKPGMTKSESKTYLDYVFNNELTPEESKAYWEWVSDAEEKYGCDVSSIPLEGLDHKTDDEILEMMIAKSEERRKLYAAKAEQLERNETR